MKPWYYFLDRMPASIAIPNRSKAFYHFMQPPLACDIIGQESQVIKPKV